MLLGAHAVQKQQRPAAQQSAPPGENKRLSTTIVLPCSGSSFKSGSNSLVNERLKSLRPENPESTINNAKAPAKTPIVAINEIIFIALFLLFVNKYRLAM